MNGRAWGCCLGLLVIVGSLGESVWVAHAQGPAPKAPATAAKAPAPAVAMATIGPRRVTRDEFDKRLQVAEQQLAARGGERPAEYKDLLSRQMLETLIRLNH